MEVGRTSGYYGEHLTAFFDGLNAGIKMRGIKCDFHSSCSEMERKE